MGNNSADNKRIARNTAMLYVRMLLLTLVNLYTVRVTLDLLGVVDYGIYNVVASVVASLGFLTGTLTSATQRYLSYHLGRGDYEAYSHTFSLLLMGFIVISAAIIAIGEAVGIFFVDDWLTIPPDRLRAAQWVFQTAVFTFVFNLMAVPYTSSLVANERMDAFAYISIADGAMKLLLVFMLMRSPMDRLIYYGVLTMIESAIVFLLYFIYCRRAFRFCRFKAVWDKALFRELTAYTGWSLFGSVSGILVNQGQSILLNIFFGPIVNTVKAIADKIYNVIISFSTNFFMAVAPQIVKAYAADEKARMLRLVTTSSKLSFMLLLVLSFPIITGMRPVLVIWLGAENVDPLMISFSQLSLIYCLVVSLEQPITQAIRATGDVKPYQLRTGIFTLMYIPMAWIVLKLGGSALTTMVVLIGLYVFVQWIRVVIAHGQVGLQYGTYMREVVVPVASVSAISVGLYFLFAMIPADGSIWKAILTMAAAAVAETAVIWTAGLAVQDRAMVKAFIARKRGK